MTNTKDQTFLEKKDASYTARVGERERLRSDVLQLKNAGYSSKDISTKLGISMYLVNSLPNRRVAEPLLGSRLSCHTLDMLLKLRDTDKSPSEIGKILNVSESVVNSYLRVLRKYVEAS